jgi:hypothetical protein
VVVLVVLVSPCFLGGLFVLALFFWDVGLSLYCYRSIRFAPVRGGTYFLCRRKESRGRSEQPVF